jgi:hypothetical protein
MKTMLAVMLVGALVAVAATEANAQSQTPSAKSQRPGVIRGQQRPGYGLGEAYNGRFNRGNPDRNFYGQNVLHGGGPYYRSTHKVKVHKPRNS